MTPTRDNDDPTPPSKFPGGPWLLEMFTQLNARMTTHSVALQKGFETTDTRIAELTKKVETVSLDLALLKQAKEIADDTITKRSAWAGVISGSGIVVLWEVIKHGIGWP